MRLHIIGNIIDQGRYAAIDENWVNPAERLGQRANLTSPDTAVTIDVVEPRRIAFRFIRFDVIDTLSLRIGESYEFRTVGNAYEMTVRFVLEE